jgi:hypothetical protein
MKPDDKDKLNKCLEILDSTDLGLSLVWLWTWSTIDSILKDDSSWQAEVTLDQMWEPLAKAVGSGHGFTLEYGAEEHHDDVVEWMLSEGFILDPTEELEEEEEEEDADDADLHQSTTE